MRIFECRCDKGKPHYCTAESDGRHPVACCVAGDGSCDWREVELSGNSEQLPKLTVEELKRRGIEWPEWAKFAYSMDTGHALFCENDPRSCIEDWGLHPPVDIPGQWNPGGFIERPKLPDWCKVGAWVYHIYSGNFMQIVREPKDRDPTRCVVCREAKGHTLGTGYEAFKPARLRPWTFEDAPLMLKVIEKRTGGEAVLSLCPDGYYRVGAFSSGRDHFHKIMQKYEQLDGLPCGALEIAEQES